MEKEFEKVTALVLQRLERFLEQEENVDPQKCKHITATLKDIKDLSADSGGPKTLVVMFDAGAEEAAQ